MNNFNLSEVSPSSDDIRAEFELNSRVLSDVIRRNMLLEAAQANCTECLSPAPLVRAMENTSESPKVTVRSSGRQYRMYC